jgi:arylsulfatase A-like enzyme
VRRHRERPAEELYDLEADPFELKNLATNPAQAAPLAELRQGLDAWMKSTNDPQKVAGQPLLLTDEFKLISKPAKKAKAGIK